MARVIVCETKIARKPFCFPITGQNLYSYEELCYYIKQYPALFQEDFVSDTLIQWLVEEIQAKTLAEKLMRLKTENVQSRLYVVAILEAYPYLSARTMKDTIAKLDFLRLKEPWFQRKEYADDLYRAGYPKQAKKLYDRLVDEVPKTEENKKRISEIWHGRGSCFAKNMQYEEAADSFKKAMEYDDEKRSKRSYWTSLYLLGKKEVIEEEIKASKEEEQTYKKFLEEMQEKEEQLQYNRDYQKLQKAVELKEEGYSKEYQKKTKVLITKWKSDYRDEVK